MTSTEVERVSDCSRDMFRSDCHLLLFSGFWSVRKRLVHKAGIPIRTACFLTHTQNYSCFFSWLLHGCLNNSVRIREKSKWCLLALCLFSSSWLKFGTYTYFFFFFLHICVFQQLNQHSKFIAHIVCEYNLLTLVMLFYLTWHWKYHPSNTNWPYVWNINMN